MMSLSHPKLICMYWCNLSSRTRCACTLMFSSGEKERFCAHSKIPSDASFSKRGLYGSDLSLSYFSRNNNAVAYKNDAVSCGFNPQGSSTSISLPVIFSHAFIKGLSSIFSFLCLGCFVESQYSGKDGGGLLTNADSRRASYGLRGRHD